MCCRALRPALTQAFAESLARGFTAAGGRTGSSASLIRAAAVAAASSGRPDRVSCGLTAKPAQA